MGIQQPQPMTPAKLARYVERWVEKGFRVKISPDGEVLIEPTSQAGSDEDALDAVDFAKA